MISWQYYPKSDIIPEHLLKVVKAFEKAEPSISSAERTLSSNKVLLSLRNNLVEIGFAVEKGDRIEDKIRVPVLFGRNGQLEKSFQVDAFQENTGTVLEVEAGRAVTNYQFLKDLFEACMMHNVDYLVVAVRRIYRKSPDFERVLTHFETLYTSGRLRLPLKGALIIGY